MSMMKKMVVGLAAVSMVASPVMADGMTAKYGLYMAADGTDIGLNYDLKEDAENHAIISVDLTMNQDGSEIAMKLDDFMCGSEGHLYVNAGKFADLIGTLAGVSEAREMLGYLGIEGEWVEVPLPELDKIIIEGETINPEEIAAPEFSEEMAADAAAIFAPFAPEADETEMKITINDDKLIEAAGAVDTFIANHKEEIVVFAANSNSTPKTTLTNLDIKPAIAGYIDAVAEGMVAVVPDMQKEEAVEGINSIIDSFVGELKDQIGSASVQGAPQITPEMLEEVKVQDAVTEALDTADVDGTIVINDEGLSGTINVSSETNTTEIVFATEAIENGYQLQIQVDGTSMYIGYTTTGESFTGFLEIPDEGVAAEVSGNCVTTENTTSASADLILTAGEQTLTFGGYLDVDSAAEVEAIELPADAANGYDVVKNITSLIVSSSMQSEGTAEE